MWHEARRSERKVHDMMDAARKRAQRRAVYLAKRRGDPQQSIQVTGSRCRVYRDDGLYQATEDQQGLIPWNGKQDVMIDRFDGRALLDFIRDPDSRRFRVTEKTEEEEELEEFVSFERYRDLIKHRRRGFSDEEGLHHVNQEMEAKTAALLGLDRSKSAQAPANKGSYSQVGFSYDGDVKDEDSDDDDDDDDDVDEEEFNSDDSNDEGMDVIAKEFGVKRYGWLVYMDKKAKEEERRQKEIVKGDPAIRKLSRKERRKASQIERERERESARMSGSRVLHHDPYRESRRSPTYEAYSRSRRSRSYSPSSSRRHGRGQSDDSHRSNPRAPKIEYITEFGGSADDDGPKLAGYTPPSSPPSQVGALNRPSSGQILEALHIDPASGVSVDGERSAKLSKPSPGSSSGLAKLSKPSGSGSLVKQQKEKKETPQERLKRIMSKQLNKQIKKDTAAEMAKKREQERQRLEKLAETSRLSRYRHRSRSRSRSYSRSPPRRYRRSRSPSRGRSSRRRNSRSRSRSRSRSVTPVRARSRSISHSRSPRVRSRSKY
ncbi:putative suppressor of white apricot domain-containing protein [Helianthus annuus]|uniref:Suppressor of white apricot domain-containing protein n=1 Tax=Helianthus annuus TaxID=4232 RepID=A0A251SH74_HELAN|nr:CLK4-associating serine/arginine rich protein [Helianthus annuus]KAF5769708.1 putative suppressor of white apricot domain-containing protein [Helianthus annuus]KAJ0464681.1 putative suppressor of white apricot domain-containing protein [Helianthus annuus]KAJ0469323.1 putative suppressor of white apricot domain-containing protein [Helianthus annuus]KAJ0486278.1 putative suppressor of white apricot domain-containing protein [Helianthus annuus]KAJ0656830.1 putative suppressor of white apricot 